MELSPEERADNVRMAITFGHSLDNDAAKVLTKALEAAERERDEAQKQLGSVLYLTKAPSTQALVDGYLEAVKLREALELIAERWPDSETGNVARAALRESPRDEP